LDSTSVREPVPDYTDGLDSGVKGLRLGVPRDYMAAGLDPEVRALTQSAIETLASLGAEIEEISLPHTDYAIATYYIIATAEASSNLARFDGVRYGRRVEGGDSLEMYCRTRGQGFGAEVKRRIMLGTYVLSSGYYDAYYLKAQRVRTLIRRDFLEAFKRVDAIVGPTTPMPAFRLGEKLADPLQMYLTDIFTVPCNLAGICGMSVPCGFTQSPKLPVGLQLLGKPFGEAALLRVGRAYEQATAWHQAVPNQ
jgi:aspartyl-tRNA(Asn)/glutamyl-tRNA(Gln) amidotransferase subunit A